jgi:3-oxoacyl-[acyl-carrier-protein] synthase II
MDHDIVITGLGVICANGRDVKEFKKNLQQGRSGVGPITLFDITPYRCKVGGQVRFDDDFMTSQHSTDRAALFALKAAQMAAEDAGITALQGSRHRIGVALGTTMGGIVSFEKIFRKQISGEKSEAHQELARAQSFHYMTDLVAEELQLGGPKSTICIACASGTQAIGYAADMIKTGKADIMLAGGSDALSEFVFSGFSALRAVTSQDRIRPYDKNRDGTVLGEGAGVLILEREDHALERGATIYARYKGHGFSNDAYHPTQPDRAGSGLARAMQNALKESGLASNEVDYINLHGTGTKANDIMETNAIRHVFAEHAARLMTSSIKPMVGHALGAAGAIEAIATVLGMKHGFLPPTLHFETADEECLLDITPNAARKVNIQVAMSLSAGFSGNNAAVIFQSVAKGHEQWNA